MHRRLQWTASKPTTSHASPLEPQTSLPHRCPTQPPPSCSPQPPLQQLPTPLSQLPPTIGVSPSTQVHLVHAAPTLAGATHLSPIPAPTPSLTPSPRNTTPSKPPKPPKPQRIRRQRATAQDQLALTAGTPPPPLVRAALAPVNPWPPDGTMRPDSQPTRRHS
jgi:hypothetical protein